MRILANYSHRFNGDSYSVTFETIGDVPREQSEATVDELFRLAKEAICRQVNIVKAPVSQASEEIPLEETPQPKQNSNGNGKPIIRDPNAPASGKQKTLIIKLAKERDIFVDDLDTLTMSEASSKIDELLATPV